LMLPLDLIRARRRKGVIKPIYLEGKTGLLETLLAVYHDHVDNKRGELSSALNDCEQLGYDYKLVRGLVSVLETRCMFKIRSVIPPKEARKLLFSEAGRRVIKSLDDRQEIMNMISGKLGVCAEDLDNSLYADLDDEYILIDFDSPDPIELTKYYNYALTLALLAYSRKIDVGYSGENEYLNSLSDSLGAAEIRKTKVNTSITVFFKSTKRISQRGARINEWFGELCRQPSWHLKAVIGYPVRYKEGSSLELSHLREGALIKRDPREDETIIEITPQKRRHEKHRFGSIVIMEELANKLGVTESGALKEVTGSGLKYRDLGGVLVLQDLYQTLLDELGKDTTLGVARNVLKGHGVRNYMPVIEALGYTVEWGSPRGESRVYRLR
jgi:predicted nuclease of restriction endonuclease-like RecB superfamily